MAMPSSRRVLVLSKRQYMSRDLLDDRYGRFRELPLGLARLGAEVRGVCLSYEARPEGDVLDADGEAQVAWTSLNLRRLQPFGSTAYAQVLGRIAEEFRPDVVWAGSDVPHLELGRRAARRFGAAFVVDLYDNFESYPLARVPGMNALLRRAVRSADAVSCISAPLARLVRDGYRATGAVAVVENAIPTESFNARDRSASLARFSLPADATIIGVAGALSPTRGIGCLLEAFLQLAAERADLHLVLAGPLDPALSLPRHDRLHYLGSLPPRDVPELLCAFDLSVICNNDSAFGRYCFPQKLYESLACRVPVVVARVGAMAELLADSPSMLYQPGDAADLAQALRWQLQQRQLPQLPIPTWNDLSQRLLALIEAGIARRA